METDIGAPLFEGLRANEEFVPERPPTPPQQHEPPIQHGQQWDHMQYYTPPSAPSPPFIQHNLKKDIFSDMDRSSYILIFIAFVLGFFMGRGMVQPVLFKSS